MERNKMAPERKASKMERKASKPLMEKRRRARINDSLIQLKDLVMEATHENTSRDSKLEKADILEMTVKYLKSYYYKSGGMSDEAQRRFINYQHGFNECINQVFNFFAGNDESMQSRLLNHLTTVYSSDGLAMKQRIAATFTPYPQPVHLQTYRQRETQTQTHQQREAQTQCPGLQITSNSSLVPPLTPTIRPIGGISQLPKLSVVPQSVPALTIVSAIPDKFTSLATNEEISVIWPQQFLSKGLQTHLIPIPVYADGTYGVPVPVTSMGLQLTPRPVSNELPVPSVDSSLISNSLDQPADQPVVDHVAADVHHDRVRNVTDVWRPW